MRPPEPRGRHEATGISRCSRWRASRVAALARAQPKQIQLGILVVGSGDSTRLINALKEGLRPVRPRRRRERGVSVSLCRGINGSPPSLAHELVALKVDLIVAFQTPAITAAKQATNEIPIVMGASGDPVGTGLVASLARPGGNVTGMTGVSGEIGGKNLSLSAKCYRGGRVGVLANVPDPFHKVFLENIQASGRNLRIEIRPFMVTGLEQLDAAFADIQRSVCQPSSCSPACRINA